MSLIHSYFGIAKLNSRKMSSFGNLRNKVATKLKVFYSKSKFLLPVVVHVVSAVAAAVTAVAVTRDACVAVASVAAVVTFAAVTSSAVS